TMNVTKVANLLAVVLGLHVVSLFFLVSFAIATEATVASNLSQSLGDQGYIVPFEAVYQHLKGFNRRTSVILGVSILLSSVVVSYCIYLLKQRRTVPPAVTRQDDDVNSSRR